MAPGMGENFFFLSVVLGMGLSWQVALAAVFVSGVVFFLLTFLRVREMIIDAIPQGLKMAIAAGVGLFICLIGLVTAGIVEPSDAGGLLRLGDLGRPPVLVALFGLALIAVLMARGVRGAMMVGILGATVLAWAKLEPMPPNRHSRSTMDWVSRNPLKPVFALTRHTSRFATTRLALERFAKQQKQDTHLSRFMVNSSLSTRILTQDHSRIRISRASALSIAGPRGNPTLRCGPPRALRSHA